jgi:hypothetical protein
METALLAIDAEKRLQASRGESVAFLLGVAENELRAALLSSSANDQAEP